MEITILEAVGSAVIALIGWGIVALVGLIKRKYAYEIVDRVGELAYHVVREVWQVYVEELKAQGKFDKEAQAEAKKMAIVKLKSYLGPKGVEMLVWLFGYSDADLDAHLAGQIESAVLACKEKDSQCSKQ